MKTTSQVRYPSYTLYIKNNEKGSWTEKKCNKCKSEVEECSEHIEPLIHPDDPRNGHGYEYRYLKCTGCDMEVEA